MGIVLPLPNTYQLGFPEIGPLMLVHSTLNLKAQVYSSSTQTYAPLVNIEGLSVLAFKEEFSNILTKSVKFVEFCLKT